MTVSLFQFVYGTIYQDQVGLYIGIYDDSSIYTWSHAQAYCEIVYGTSLASIHSSTDESACSLARYTTSYYAWIGLNDISTEGVWTWSDDTPYDYAIAWSSGQPDNSGNEDCVHFFSTASASFNDRSCDSTHRQFVCNAPTESPTDYPTDKPTNHPTFDPTDYPTNNPSNDPSITPSAQPTLRPSGIPSSTPSAIPSTTPSAKPTYFPTVTPSDNPSNSPSLTPSQITQTTETTRTDMSTVTTHSALTSTDSSSDANELETEDDGDDDGSTMGITGNVLFWPLVSIGGLFILCCVCIMFIFLCCVLSEKGKRKELKSKVEIVQSELQLQNIQNEKLKEKRNNHELQMAHILQTMQKSMQPTTLMQSNGINGAIGTQNTNMLQLQSQQTGHMHVADGVLENDMGDVLVQSVKKNDDVMYEGIKSNSNVFAMNNDDPQQVEIRYNDDIEMPPQPVVNVSQAIKNKSEAGGDSNTIKVSGERSSNLKFVE